MKWAVVWLQLRLQPYCPYHQGITIAMTLWRGIDFVSDKVWCILRLTHTHALYDWLTKLLTTVWEGYEDVHVLYTCLVLFGTPVYIASELYIYKILFKQTSVFCMLLFCAWTDSCATKSLPCTAPRIRGQIRSLTVSVASSFFWLRETSCIANLAQQRTNIVPHLLAS